MQRVRDVLAILWFVVTGLICVPIIIISTKYGMLFTKKILCPGIFFWLGIKVQAQGMENLDPNKVYVFTANHESHLDTPAIYWKYPHILYFIAKAALKKAPIVGWFISLSGMIFVDRGDSEKAKASLARALEMIKNGKRIISFPEGTRTKDGNIARFKKGLFQLALDAELDVVPVTVKGAYEIWPSSRMSTKRGNIIIHFSQPVDHNQFQGDAISFANHVRAQIESKKTELTWH